MLVINSKNNTIEFTLEVANTTFDKIKPRLVIEVNNSTTLIPLQVEDSGVVVGDIPINEDWGGKEGRVKLEIINDGNYFVPFDKKVLFESESRINDRNKFKKVFTESKSTTRFSIKDVKLINSQRESKSIIDDAKKFFKEI